MAWHNKTEYLIYEPDHNEQSPLFRRYRRARTLRRATAVGVGMGAGASIHMKTETRRRHTFEDGQKTRVLVRETEKVWFIR